MLDIENAGAAPDISVDVSRTGYTMRQGRLSNI